LAEVIDNPCIPQINQSIDGRDTLALDCPEGMR